ncbi:hypothetical protein ANANG_G00147160 [Anguilla anguilla]|uniref:Secreted protein n=1 Tax=Anguilla anguilla TaxID=7936 RepID=A0A9D3MCS9_ANGAN|nr:hypothetical protein ANANG_G00147160 [Anguilla anguilla]
MEQVLEVNAVLLLGLLQTVTGIICTDKIQMHFLKLPCCMSTDVDLQLGLKLSTCFQIPVPVQVFIYHAKQVDHACVMVIRPCSHFLFHKLPAALNDVISHLLCLYLLLLVKRFVPYLFKHSFTLHFEWLHSTFRQVTHRGQHFTY